MCCIADIRKGIKGSFEMKSYEITSAAALAAISASLQLVHIGVSVSYIWIDLVAIPWIVAFFLYGGRSALVVSLVAALLIILFTPFGLIGGPIKWVATLPMWLLPWIWHRASGMKLADFRKVRVLAIWVILAVLIRGAIILPADYYVAFPLVGVSPAQAMSILPWWLLFGLNVIQGALEVIVAWLLVFRFRLDRFAAW